MVNYCSIEDIEKQLSTPILIQLTSDNGQDVTNRVVAKEAIIYASALIDGYSRRVHNGLPEQIESAYNNAISTLRDIQKGIVTLQGENDLLETSNFNPDEYRANKTMLDRIFNKRKLSEY